MTTLTKKDIIIDIEILQKNNGHTSKNLDVSKRVFLPESQPELYDEGMLSTRFGLTYNRRDVVKLSDITLESTQGRQGVRVGANEKRPEIESSIKNGWKLNTSPIAVYFSSEKPSEYKILEGRTRLGILGDLGITGNIVVDLYEHIDQSIDPQDFAAYCNGDEVSPPKGHTTEESALMIIQNKLKSGELKSDDSLETGAAFRKLVKDIMSTIKNLSLPLKKKHAEEFAKGSVSTINVQNIVEFSDKDPRKYAWEVLGIRNTSKVNYLFTSTDEYVAVKAALQEYTRMIENGEGEKELRVVTLLETLDPGKGYENHWYLANYCVGEKMKRHLDTLIIMTGGDPQKCKLKIWGTIPQCHSMADTFPMDKLVRYGKKPTKEQCTTLVDFSSKAKQKYSSK